MNPPWTPSRIQERMDRLTGAADERGCTPWLGYTNPVSGYGQVTLSRSDRQHLGLNQRIWTAPWVACRLAHGPPEPGLVVLHGCDNRPCVNPAHLSWGTMSQNGHDAYQRGAQPNGERHPAGKHPDSLIAELRRRVANGETACSVANQLGIDPSHAYKIVKGYSRTLELVRNNKEISA